MEDEPKIIPVLLEVLEEYFDDDCVVIRFGFEYDGELLDFEEEFKIQKPSDMVKELFKLAYETAYERLDIEQDIPAWTRMRIYKRQKVIRTIKDIFSKINDYYYSSLEQPLNTEDVLDIETILVDLYLDTFNTSTMSFEDRANIFISKGKSDLLARIYESAIFYLLKSVALAPQNPFTHFYLGYAYQYTGKHSMAHLYFIQALENSDEADWVLYEAAGISSILAQDFEQAAKIFERGLSLMPNNINMLIGLANVRFVTGMDYLEYVDQAFKIDPRMAGDLIKNQWIYKKPEEEKDARWDLAAAAAYLNIHQYQLFKKARRRHIPCYELEENVYYFVPVQIDRWLELCQRYGLLRRKYDQNLLAAERAMFENNQNLDMDI